MRIKTVLSGTIYRLGQPAVSSQRRPVRPDTSGRKELFERIRASSPDVLAREFIETGTVYVFADQATYSSFKARVSVLIPQLESIAIVGSANWQFSLNPEKGFREFGDHSDIDVAIVSRFQFHLLWEEMRENHRRHYYALSHEDKAKLRRNSENVYAGFISPDWIPKRDRRRHFEYKQILNSLSDQTVRFLKVKMMFFRNTDEAIDYYARGFRAARKVIH